MALFTHGSNGRKPACQAMKKTRLRYSAQLPCASLQCVAKASRPMNPLWHNSQTTGGVAMACCEASKTCTPATIGGTASALSSARGDAAPPSSPYKGIQCEANVGRLWISHAGMYIAFARIRACHRDILSCGLATKRCKYVAEVAKRCGCQFCQHLSSSFALINSSKLSIQRFVSV